MQGIPSLDLSQSWWSTGEGRVIHLLNMFWMEHLYDKRRGYAENFHGNSLLKLKLWDIHLLVVLGQAHAGQGVGRVSPAKDPKRWSTWDMQLLDKIWVEHAFALHGAVKTIFCLFGMTSLINQTC